MPVRLGKEVQEMPRCCGLRIVARLPEGLTWQAERAAKQIKFIPAAVNACVDVYAAGIQLQSLLNPPVDSFKQIR